MSVILPVFHSPLEASGKVHVSGVTYVPPIKQPSGRKAVQAVQQRVKLIVPK